MLLIGDIFSNNVRFFLSCMVLITGTGKTSLAAHIAVLGHFSFVKVLPIRLCKLIRAFVYALALYCRFLRHLH